MGRKKNQRKKKKSPSPGPGAVGVAGAAGAVKTPTTPDAVEVGASAAAVEIAPECQSGGTAAGPASCLPPPPVYEECPIFEDQTKFLQDIERAKRRSSPAVEDNMTAQNTAKVASCPAAPQSIVDNVARPESPSLKKGQKQMQSPSVQRKMMEANVRAESPVAQVKVTDNKARAGSPQLQASAQKATPPGSPRSQRKKKKGGNAMKGAGDNQQQPPSPLAVQAPSTPSMPIPVVAPNGSSPSPQASPKDPLVSPKTASPLVPSPLVSPLTDEKPDLGTPEMKKAPVNSPRLKKKGVGSPSLKKKGMSSPSTKRKETSSPSPGKAGQHTPTSPLGPGVAGHHTPTSPLSPDTAGQPAVCPFLAGIMKADSQTKPAEAAPGMPPLAGKSRKRQRVKADEVAIEIVATDVCSSKTLGMSWDDVAFNDLKDICDNSDDNHPIAMDMTPTTKQAVQPDLEDDEMAGIDMEPFLFDEPLLLDTPAPQNQSENKDKKDVSKSNTAETDEKDSHGFKPLPIDMTIVDDVPMSSVPKIEEEDGELDGMDFEPLLGDFSLDLNAGSMPEKKEVKAAGKPSPPVCHSPGPMSYADAIRKPKVEPPPDSPPEVTSPSVEDSSTKVENQAGVLQFGGSSGMVLVGGSSGMEVDVKREHDFQAVMASMREEGQKWQQQLQAEQAEIHYMEWLAGQAKPSASSETATASAPESKPCLPMKLARESPPKDIAQSWRDEAERMEAAQKASACEAAYQRHKSTSPDKEHVMKSQPQSSEGVADKTNDVYLGPQTKKPTSPITKSMNLREESNSSSILDANANIRDSLADSCNQLQQVKAAECCEGRYQQSLTDKQKLAASEQDVSMITDDLEKEAESKKGHRVNIIEIDEVATQTSPKRGSLIDHATQTIGNVKTAKEEMKMMLRAEMERRAEAEQRWRMSEHELQQLRQQLASKQRHSVQLEAEAVNTKGDLSFQSKMAEELSRRNQELEQALEVSQIKIAHLEQQVAQGSTFQSGVDLMLDLKLANGKAKDAERRMQLMERDLAEAKVQIKDLEKKNFLLHRASDDMIPMATHQEQVMKLQTQCHDAEMRLLQLEKEYLKMSHLQEVCLSPDSPSMEARLSWPSLSESIGKVSWATMAARGPEEGSRNTPERRTKPKHQENIARQASTENVPQPSPEKIDPQKFNVAAKAVNPDISTGEESDWSSSDSDPRVPAHNAKTGQKPNSPPVDDTVEPKLIREGTPNSERNNKRPRPPVPPKPASLAKKQESTAKRPVPPPVPPKPKILPKPHWNPSVTKSNGDCTPQQNEEQSLSFEEDAEVPKLRPLKKPRGPSDRRKPTKYNK